MSSRKRHLAETDLEGSGENLAERTLRGVRWLTLGRIATQLAMLASGVLVARLVTPAEFGRASVVLVIWTIAGIVGVEGLGQSIVQRRTISRKYLEAATLMSLVGGATMGLLTAAVGATLLGTFIDGETAQLTRVVAVGFVINALVTVPSAVLARRLDFRQLAANEVVSQAIGIIATLGLLTLGGLNALGIVLGALAASVAAAIAALSTAPASRPRLHRQLMRELFAFALPVQGSALLYAGQRLGGVAIVGTVLGAQSAGLFQRAYGLTLGYLTKISGIMLTVAFPVYSRAPDLATAIRLRRRIVRVHSAALFPFLLLIIAEAPVIVPWVYGGQWTGAVGPTQLIAVGGLCATVVTGTGPIILAAGRPDALLRYNAVSLLAYVGILVAIGSMGLTEVCVAFVAYQLINLVAAQQLLLRRIVGIPFGALAGDAGPALAAGLLLLAVSWTLSRELVDAGMHPLPNLVVTTAAGLAAYAAALRLLFPDAWRDLTLLVDRVTNVSFLRRFRRASDAPDEPTEAV